MPAGAPAGDVGGDQCADMPPHQRAGLIEQEQAQQTVDEDAGIKRRDGRCQSPTQPAGALRALVHGRELAHELVAASRLARELALEFSDVLALEHHDLERVQRGAVAGDGIDEAVQKRLDCRQRILVAGGEQGETHAIDQRQRYLFAHGVEQGGLVAEMPIDGTARYARSRRDVPQGGACHAAADKFTPRGAKNLLPCSLGFLLGATHC